MAVFDETVVDKGYASFDGRGHGRGVETLEQPREVMSLEDPQKLPL
jgi:hypothetical protein